MDVKEEIICRLCLNVAESDFVIIDETIRRMFEDLSLRVNLDVSTDPIICKNCREASIKCHDFKSVCMEREERILLLAVGKNRATFELKNIFNNGNDIDIVDDELICRFCLNRLNGNNFVSLDTLMNDNAFAETLQSLLPGMDLELIKNPVICTSCRQNLDCYMQFSKNRLDIEDKISKYVLQREVKPRSAHIKLSDAQRFLWEKFLKPIKTETKEEDVGDALPETYNPELIKVEEASHIKDEYNSRPSHFELKSETDMGEAWEASNENSSSAPTRIPPKPQIFECAKCTYRTKRRGNLNAHILMHKDTSEVKMYKCSTCAFESKYKKSLQRHILIHKAVSEVEMYKCPTCTFETKHKNALKRHSLVHRDVTEVNMYKCSSCTFETKQKNGLERHIVSIHKDVTEVDMYKCSVCTFQTKDKDGLRRHTLIHKNVTEVEMYRCSTCTFVTKRKRALKRHVLVHRDVTEVKMYGCSMCSFQTKRNSNLRVHIKRHKGMSVQTSNDS